MIKQINLVDASDIACCDFVDSAISQCSYDSSFELAYILATLSTTHESCTPLTSFTYMNEYGRILEDLSKMDGYNDALITYVRVDW